MRTVIESGFQAVMPAVLAKELLDAHEEVKRNYYLGGLRLSAVEGGRFCEAAFRILQHVTTRAYTPLSETIGADQVIQSLRQIPQRSHPDSIRLHVPRALRVVYDIRNNRDAAHLADGIDPNLQDATLVVSVVDWILAEFVRLYHNVGASDAQRIVEDLVTRVAPAVEDFAGFLKVLRTDLQAGDHCLLVLYQRGASGATMDELTAWARPSMRRNLSRTLDTLENTNAMIHQTAGRFQITRSGQKHVEMRRLFDFGGSQEARPARRARRRRRSRPYSASPGPQGENNGR